MKNFLKVLLVGTILVSATDGYSEMFYFGIDPGSNSRNHGDRLPLAIDDTGEAVLTRVTGALGNQGNNGPLKFNSFEGVLLDGKRLAYWRDGRWYVDSAGTAVGLRVTDNNILDFSPPKNLTITGEGGYTFSLGSGTSDLKIQNAGLLDGNYTIKNVKTPSGIMLNGQYEVKNLGNGQLQFTSTANGTRYVRDVKGNGWTMTQGDIEIKDYGGGRFEVYKGEKLVYYADNVEGGTNSAHEAVGKLEIDGQTYQLGQKDGKMNVLELTEEPASKATTPPAPEKPAQITTETKEPGTILSEKEMEEMDAADSDGNQLRGESENPYSDKQQEIWEDEENGAGLYDTEESETVKVVKGGSSNLISEADWNEIVKESTEAESLVSIKTEAGGIVVKDTYTGDIFYRPADSKTAYSLDSSGAYFVDAKGNPISVKDPEAFTAFRETSYVDKIETQYGTFERTVDGTYVGSLGEFTPFAGKVDIGGVSYTVGAPSTMPVKVMSIDGGMATVNFNGFDYKISADAIGSAAVGGAAQLTAEQVAQLGKGFGAYASGFMSGVGATFSNFFDAAIGTVMMPVNLVKGVVGAFKDFDKTTEAIGKFVDQGLKNLGQNWDAGFTSFGQALGVDNIQGLDAFAKNPAAGLDGLKDVFGNDTKSIQEFIDKQVAEAQKLAKAEAVSAKEVLQALPVAVSNVIQYPIMILQTTEAGKQNDTTKQVKVKAENGLLDSQGAPSDSTVDGQLQGTNLQSAASQMAFLLEYNPVDLNLLKMDDLDLSKDRDQKTLRQRRDLLLQMYATSAQIIAEGSNDISEKFYERIALLSESLPQTTGSLGSASVLNDSERYPYFEMVRQTALSATQLGLKGADILPNLRIIAPESQEQ